MFKFLAFLTFVLLPSMVLVQVGQVAPASAAATNGAGPNPVETKAKAEAKKLHDEGRKLFLKGQFEPALEKFQAAVKWDPQDATLQFNVCRCLEGMKNAGTVSCFEKFLHEFPDDEGVGYAARIVDGSYQKPVPLPPASAPTSTQASAPPPPLAPRESCVLLLREIPANAEVKVNSKPADPKTPIQTDCAMQRIEVLVAGQLVAGDRVVTTREKPAEWVYEPNTPVNPALVKDNTSSGWGRSEWGWTSISVGALAAAAAGYFTYSCMNNFAAADERNGNHAYTVGEFRSAVSDGESNRTMALVSGGVALVTGGLGAYLLISGDDESPTTAIAPSFGGLVVTGTF